MLAREIGGPRVVAAILGGWEGVGHHPGVAAWMADLERRHGDALHAVGEGLHTTQQSRSAGCCVGVAAEAADPAPPP